MICVKILDLLRKDGRSIYWLSQQTGISYPNVYRLVNNKASAIRLENIEIYCQVLNCTPSDLFVIDFDKPEGQPLPEEKAGKDGKKGAS